jgi:hypothetical protein
LLTPQYDQDPRSCATTHRELIARHCEAFAARCKGKEKLTSSGDDDELKFLPFEETDHEAAARLKVFETLDRCREGKRADIEKRRRQADSERLAKEAKLRAEAAAREAEEQAEHERLTLAALEAPTVHINSEDLMVIQEAIDWGDALQLEAAGGSLRPSQSL